MEVDREWWGIKCPHLGNLVGCVNDHFCLHDEMEAMNNVDSDVAAHCNDKMGRVPLRVK